jgi:hypothetical protein
MFCGKELKEAVTDTTRKSRKYAIFAHIIKLRDAGLLTGLIALQF